MGTLGTNIQTTVTNVIENINFRTDVTINTISRTQGSQGGYAGPSEVTSSASAYAIPYDYISDSLNPQDFGDLNEGEIRLIFKGVTTIDIDDTVTYASKTWLIREIEPLVFNDVTVAKVIRLSLVN